MYVAVHSLHSPLINPLLASDPYGCKAVHLRYVQQVLRKGGPADAAYSSAQQEESPQFLIADIDVN
jgi:hypothetical protein